uniref:Uncharacterized protein n=1 Tax=Prymnesium polylepis TaxID=72548 RepID=A0A7S4HG22_9EUKA|mmetsp:Transcript_16231/g.41099  ORF Transcript_16231/g.41099 Transcript_16231/m.41099 type:complete len:159 (+) Transcript_16231:293-769(+)
MRSEAVASQEVNGITDVIFLPLELGDPLADSGSGSILPRMPHRSSPVFECVSVVDEAAAGKIFCGESRDEALTLLPIEPNLAADTGTSLVSDGRIMRKDLLTVPLAAIIACASGAGRCADTSNPGARLARGRAARRALLARVTFLLNTSFTPPGLSGM